MGPGMEIQTYERKTLLGLRYFFRIVDVGNHEKLAASQTYKTLYWRDRTANRLATALGCKIRKVAR